MAISDCSVCGTRMKPCRRLMAHHKNMTFLNVHGLRCPKCNHEEIPNLPEWAEREYGKLESLREINTQLTTERERAERAEDDYGALKMAAGNLSRVLQAGYVDPEEYEQTLAELERILSQPHPSGELHEELERLRAQAETDKDCIEIATRRFRDAQAEAKRCKDALDSIATIYELSRDRGESVLGQATNAYDMRCIARQALNAGKE